MPDEVTPLDPEQKWEVRGLGTRYYGAKTREMVGSRITIWIAHHVVGATALHRTEIAKTLLYRWLLAPALIVVPIVGFFSDVDALIARAGIVAMAFPVAWLIGVGSLIERLHKRYVDGEFRRSA